MTIGQILLELRKEKKLSQEEVADILNVSRQTISKWETDQSNPDFDKIIPLCKLYEISADELLTGRKGNAIEEKDSPVNENNLKKKRAIGISLGILFYFISIIWIMITIPVSNMNPIISSAVFLLICGIATFIIVYACMSTKKENIKVKKEEPSILKQIKIIISTVMLIIYLLVSFLTMAWHVTWILWIVYSLIIEVVKLIFMLGSDKNEK